MFSPQTLQRLTILLKVSLTLLCIGYLSNELFVKEKFILLWRQFVLVQRDASKYFLLTMAVLLVFVNWAIETSKWKLLLNSIEKLDWFRAFRAVIGGISMSIFTPNRVGEFVARAFYLQSNHRIKGALLSVIGSFSQLIVTLVVGSFCFGFYFIQNQTLNHWELLLLKALPFLISIPTLLFYYKMDVLYTLLSRIKRARKIRFYMNVFTVFTNAMLTKILGLSILRFAIFSMQFYLLLLFFNIQINLPDSLMITSSIFFVLTVIPTITFAELGIRGAVSVYFLQGYAQNELNILASSLTLWCINLALPALLGLLFLPNLNYSRK